ncbi:MAG: hypothetical protein ACOYNU_04580 [Bacteroidales bacterium]
MKKYNHPVDGYFRENLKDHQITPSDAGKKAFLSDAMQLPRSDKKRRKGIILLGVILIALIGAGIFMWSINSHKSSPNSANESKSSINKSFSSTNQTSRGFTTQVNKNPVHLPASSQPGLVQKSLVPDAKASGQNQVAVLKSVVPDTSGVKSYLVGEDQIKPFNNIQKPDSDSLNPPGIAVVTEQGTTTSADSGISIMNKEPGTIASSDTLQNNNLRRAVEKDRRWMPNIGFYYTPEWMFNTMEGSKFVNNFGVEGTFHFGRFSVRTGAGLSVAKGTNELTVEYNDFLGAYNQLDSMKFAWNDPSHQYIPTYYMTQQDIWDSLLKLDYPKVIKRYTYIQIPLIMGYDFWRSEKFSVGIRVGPVMSVLLTTKQLSGEYDPGTKRIVSINDITPGQVNLNWQIMGGLNASINLTRNLILEIEPCGRYYFNSVYEKPVNNTKPWSLGIRTAIIISFN